MRKEIPGAARTTSPGSTTILLRRALRENNPWNQTEEAADIALGHRYSCCGSTWFDRITDYHFKIYHDPNKNIR